MEDNWVFELHMCQMKKKQALWTTSIYILEYICILYFYIFLIIRDSDSEPENENENENVIQKKSSEPCHHCQNWNVFASAVVKCPSCFWHDNYCICPVCGHEIPVDAEHVKESFHRCYDCGALKHENFKTSKVSLYSPS